MSDVPLQSQFGQFRSGLPTVLGAQSLRKLHPCRAQAPPAVCFEQRRRDALLTGLAVTAGWASNPPEALATKTITTLSGEEVEAFEFDLGLRIVSLSGSVPADWERDFKTALRGKAKLSLERRSQLLNIFDELSQPQKKKSAATADAVTMADVFLGPAIQRNLIQPLEDPESQSWWELLSPRWKRLLKRDSHGRISDKGLLWGVPYRWGCTLIACRTDKLRSRHGGQPVEDWQDLLQPALRNRIGFGEGPRDFLGAVFKSLGLPLNPSLRDLKACKVSKEQLQQQVDALKQQVKHFSGRELQQALATGDTWAAVGSSSDLIPLAQRHNNIALTAPASGTALWSDLWVVPSAAKGGHRQVNAFQSQIDTNVSHLVQPTRSTSACNSQVEDGDPDLVLSGEVSNKLYEQAGPSPLLTAWMLYGLEPARANRKRGLQGGASPRLLPGSVDMKRCQSRGGRVGVRASKLGDPGSLNVSLGEMLPSSDVLERSEFLEPLDREIGNLIWDILLPA